MFERIAFVSMHTCPLEQPGVGSAGGMNIFVREVAAEITRRGIAVDVFTRRVDESTPTVTTSDTGFRVIHLDVGPAKRLETGELVEFVEPFSRALLAHAHAEGISYDLVHTHYWLSSWSGVILKRELGIPMADSFHTLGRMKDLTRRPGDAPSDLARIAAESEVIAMSDCVIASTPSEAAALMEYYGADPTRICVSAPGVDHAVFTPGDKAAARATLGLPEAPLVLYVGRIQPLKGIDVAVNTLGRLRDRVPDAQLVVVGGPSGPYGDEELASVNALVERRGLGDVVHFREPAEHGVLADYYRAADVLLFPSRSETFGLVAIEAQACGTPVVAASVGGLTYAVHDEHSGLLVNGWDADEYVEAISRILSEPDLADHLSKGAVEFAERFSWSTTVDRFMELYDGITAG